MKQFLFTSESVTEGHPDKIADCISDTVLDAMLTQDKFSRVACETMVTTGLVVIAGEVTSNAIVDIKDLASKAILDIGYDDSRKGFDGNTCAIMLTLDKQSPDIAQGVNEQQGIHEDQGAGDQGLMFGYAVNETETLMPMPIHLAHLLTKELTNQRKSSRLNYLRPDGKSQVTVLYEDGVPKQVTSVVLSCQHSEDVEYDQIKHDLIEQVGKKVIPQNMLADDIQWHINPTGKFIIGGPMGDCGLTGRKIIVDTYGGMGRHGGGCFSGKDPSKVDRSGAYAARYIAKNIVAAELANECEIQISYAIGYPHPISINVNTFGTARVDQDKIVQAVKELFPLTPKWIIETLDLLRPIYKASSAYGHFGRTEESFSWEKTDLKDQLKSLF